MHLRLTTWLPLLLLLTPLSARAADAQPAAATPEAARTGPPKRPAAEIEKERKECLSCHDDPELEVDLDSGEVKNMRVDPAALPASVHKDLGCSDCHPAYLGKTNGHKAKSFPTLREYRLHYTEQCKECHFATYAQTLDGVHHTVTPKEGRHVPVCVDCHGAHAMKPPAKPRTMVSATCAECHADVARTYATSVHGEALTKDNPDVPVCTDCHRSHDILDPKSSQARLRQPDTCGACHADAKMMKKYGVSTAVLSTYLADFHGTTALLQKTEAGAKPVVALCSDCHGVHDIKKVNAPDSKVMKANLVATCQKCHPDATADFPAAWLSHYEPSWEKTPAVKAVTVFYDVLIPFMIGGLVLQVLLHLWRILVNR